MRRREFISLFGGAALGWPIAAPAQKTVLPVIGFLHSASPGPYADALAAFRQGLTESGYSEGQNVLIEYRWAEGHYDQLPALAADLVRRQVAVIAAAGGTPAAFAAKAATSTIPSVFAVGVDPVRSGLVASLNRPGGNMTGVAMLAGELAPKLLELLHELVPTAAVIGVLTNPTNPLSKSEMRELQEGARSLQLQLSVLNASTAGDIDAAFAALVEHKAGALVVAGDAFLYVQRHQIVALAARHGMPAVCWRPEFTQIGGLMSYGISLTDVYRQIGIYTGRILKGAKPADMPIQQITKVPLVINLKTAKALDLTVPQSLLARADEVIE
jgi:putative ABC transport system substrate-binding protein